MPINKLLAGLNLPGAVSTDEAVSSGTFTGALTGLTTAPTGTVRYLKVGKLCVLYIPLITGTSNATAATVTGAPAACFPTRAQVVRGIATDNGTVVDAVFTIGTDGVITLRNGITSADFTDSGTKAINLQTIVYALD